ncbi:hypothetical protein GYB57_05860 [bacterium]|nr:hypothetical protein [bacterium]
MIKRGISIMSAVILAMSLFIACSQEPTSFSIDEQGLTQILNNLDYREDFINDWEMQECFKDEMSTIYCYQDSTIQLTILKEDGYILSINNLEFLEFEGLLSQLEKKYDSQDVKGLEGFEKHLGIYDLSFGKYFSNDKFDIFVVLKKSDNSELYVITVNELSN